MKKARLTAMDGNVITPRTGLNSVYGEFSKAPEYPYPFILYYIRQDNIKDSPGVTIYPEDIVYNEEKDIYTFVDYSERREFKLEVLGD
jgi:hypothetical protein